MIEIHTFIVFPSEVIFGFGISKLAFGKMIRFSSIMAVLITETIPLAPSRCPKFDFADPR